MRILAVTPYHPPEGGGLERYAQETLSRLARQGHAVRIETFTREGRDDVDDGALRVHREPPRWTIGNAPISPGLLGRLSEAIEAFAPEVVLAHTPVPFPAEMAYLAARRHERPFVVTYHAGQLTGATPLRGLLASLDRLTLQRAMLDGADELIAVGPYVRDNALAGHVDRTTIIPPGVDLDRFQAAPPAGSDTILFVGPLDRAYRWKGLDVLWRAFEQVHEAHPSATLRLVGTGDRARQLARRAQALDGAVELAGYVDDEQLVDEYQAATLVCLPSTSPAEAFGMVLAEAGACARPVVASRVGGIPDLVRHGRNGLLAEPGDPDDLADQLLALLEDPEAASRMGARGHKIVARDHDWDEIARRTEQVLQSAIDRAGASRGEAQ